MTRNPQEQVRYSSFLLSDQRILHRRLLTLQLQQVMVVSTADTGGINNSIDTVQTADTLQASIVRLPRDVISACMTAARRPAARRQVGYVCRRINKRGDCRCERGRDE